jgi:hypothetical protein
LPEKLTVAQMAKKFPMLKKLYFVLFKNFTGHIYFVSATYGSVREAI